MATTKRPQTSDRQSKRVTEKKPQPALPTAVSDVSEFKRDRAGALLVLPSGKIVKARAVGMEAFVTNGMIPNELMPWVQQAMKEGKAPRNDEIDFTPELMSQIAKMFDDVAMFVVTEPHLFEIPASEDERRDDLVYIDEIDFEDKSFIYQFACGGTRDVTQFREQQG